MRVLHCRIRQTKEILLVTDNFAVTITDLCLGIRTAKYTISDIDTRITDYESKFRELKTAFVEGVAVQTGVTVMRMMNVVNHTGMSDVLYPQTAVHGPGTQQNPSI